MSVRFPLDENMEPQLRHKLDAYGYDVEHVGDVAELDLGTTDDQIVRYSAREERVILTYDDDFITDHDYDAYHCAIYFEDRDFSGREVAEVVHRMASTYPESEFRGLEFGSKDWL